MYRVVCIEPGHEAEVSRFESAYQAVDYIAAARSRGDDHSAHLGIVDGDDTLLFRPDDLAETVQGGAL